MIASIDRELIEELPVMKKLIIGHDTDAFRFVLRLQHMYFTYIHLNKKL